MDTNMRGVCFPSRYLQGYGILKQFAFHAGRLGFFKYAVVMDENPATPAIKADFELSAQMFEAATKMKPAINWIKFGGECCEKEIARVMGIVKELDCDVVIGCGGGKALDTAKSAAFRLGKPVIICPTIASNDAPCSMVSVIYTDEHVYKTAEFQHTNPILVYVDTYYISQAPARYLAAGMGDALATCFEARGCQSVYAQAMSGGYFTKTAAVIAETCLDTLMEYGVSAYYAVKNKLATMALEEVVEANVLMSGLGFESNGISIAHCVYNGFTALPVEDHKLLHGEYVAYGTLVELIMENADKEVFDEVMRFCIKVDLPVTYEDLQLPNMTEEQINTIVDGAFNIDPSSITHEAFPVEKGKLADAIKMVNALGKMYKEGGSIL